MKLRGEGTILDCGGFFFHASKVRKSTDFGLFRQHAWTDEAHTVGPRVSLHLSWLQIAPWLLLSMPPSGRDGKLGLEPRAESQATSQEAHRLLEKGQMLHLQYMAFSEFYLRFLFGIFCLWQCGFSFRTEKEAKIIHNQSERMLQLRLGASAWLPFYCSYCFSKGKPIIYALLQPQQQCRDGHVLITNFRLRFRTFQCTLLLIRSSEQSLFLITFLSFPPLNNPLPHLCSCLPEV